MSESLTHSILPWLQSPWLGLQQQLQQQRLPHALLITGQVGIGKRSLARALAHSALCTQTDAAGMACGVCQSCKLITAGSHPDYRDIYPEEGSKQIKIDAIRALIKYTSLTTQYGGMRFVLVHPADRLNANAANALLKTLEEPAAGTVLILISETPAHLPATIRSRCQLLSIPRPATQAALDWLIPQLDDASDAQVLLNLALGSPLQALAMAEGDDVQQHTACFNDWSGVALGKVDPLELAEQWFGVWKGTVKKPGRDGGLQRPLQWVIGWLDDVIRLLSGGGVETLGNAELAAGSGGDSAANGRLQALCQRLDLDTAFQRRDDVLQAIGRLNTNLNQQLLLEDLFIPWSRPVRR